MKPLFRHSYKDAFLIIQTLLTLVIAFTFAFLNLNMLSYLLIAPFHILLILNLQNSSLHHHTHWATFNSKSLNNLYELLIAAASGLKPQSYRLAHASHHRYVNDTPINNVSKDKVSVFEHGVNREIENVWKFCYRGAKYVFLDPWKYVFYQIWQPTRPNTAMMNFRLWRREQFSIVIFFLSIMFINFFYGVWLMFVIYSLSYFLNYSWHYGEHYGAHHNRGNTEQDAVGIYNKWYNFFCFNAGYHQEHHYNPKVHWTQQHTLTNNLPLTRITAKGMHILNVPWYLHLKNLFKS